MARAGLIALLLLVSSNASALDWGLRVGTCVEDITPVSPALADEYESAFGHAATVNHSDPVFMAGFGNDRQATGYHDKLWARGVVVDGPGGRVALVALDLIGYFTNEIETVRSLVSPDSHVDFVVVTSTHQHEGPDTLGLWGPDELVSGVDYGYLDFVNAAVARCIDQAAARLRPARVRFGLARSDGLSLGTDPEDDGFGVSDGKVLAGDDALAPDTAGRIVDSRLSVMQFTDRRFSKRALATIVNFASHPESLGSNNTLITSDFPHYVRKELEHRFGGTAIWVSGALGVLQGPLDIDVQDPDTGLPAPRRTFRFAEVHGTQLAERAASGLPHWLLATPIAPIRFASTHPVPVRLDNPFFRLFTAIGVLNTRRSLYTDGVPDPGVDTPFPPPFDSIPQSTGSDIHTEVGVLRIGMASLAIVPTELDPQIGEQYRSAMSDALHPLLRPFQHTFIVGLGNDHIGYQVPFAKWDDSCHACAPYILAGFPQFCPVQPIDCNTVFSNNVGQQVDPSVTNALLPLIEETH
jgi:hypothetical protein